MDKKDKEFLEKTENLKSTLYSAEKNKQGRFEVKESDFIRCICTLIEEYAIYLNSTQNFLPSTGQIQEKLFLFENLETNLSWKNLHRQIKDVTSTEWNRLTQNRAVPLCKFTLKNCKLSELNLETTINNHLFSQVSVNENCEVHRFILIYSFFNSSQSLPLYCEKSSFDNVEFMGNETGPFIKPIEFSYCHFKYTFRTKNACIFDTPLNFLSCRFNENPKVGFETSYCNSVFNSSVSFSSSHFFLSPKFHNVGFHSDTNFHSCKFYDVNSISAIANYRILKQAFQSLGNEHDFARFQALELETRRNTLLPKIWQLTHPEWTVNVSSWFLKLVNNYGQNFWLPWIWLIGSLFMFTGLYWLTNGIGCNLSKLGEADLWLKDVCGPRTGSNWDLYFSYSFQRFWGPLGLIFDSGLLSPKTFFIKLVSISQFIFSSILWYLIIIQIRRQFRL